MKMLAAFTVRTLICAIAAVGLYAGAVLATASVREERAIASAHRKIMPEPGEMMRQEEARWWEAASAWQLAGFQGRAATAEVRAALATPIGTVTHRQETASRVKAALALRPTATEFWLQLAEFQLVDEAPLADIAATLRMARLTAPREVEPALARTLLVLQNWERILALGGTPDEVEDLRRSVAQDIAGARIGYAPIEIDMVRTAFMALPEGERALFRDTLTGRMGAKLADGYLRQPKGS